MIHRFGVSLFGFLVVTVAEPPALTDVTTSKPFDCNAGLNNWQAGWSIEKKKWCCWAEKKGCPVKPFDCNAGLNNWQAGWSIDKKKWCCWAEQKGCLVSSTPSRPGQALAALFSQTASAHTGAPTAAPSAAPMAAPTAPATAAPSAVPTAAPTAPPTAAPAAAPTAEAQGAVLLGPSPEDAAKDPLADMFQQDDENAAVSGGATEQEMTGSQQSSVDQATGAAEDPLAAVAGLPAPVSGGTTEQDLARSQQSSADQTTEAAEDPLAEMFQQDDENAAVSGGTTEQDMAGSQQNSADQTTEAAEDPLAAVAGLPAPVSGGTTEQDVAGSQQSSADQTTEAAEDPPAAVMDVGAAASSLQEERKLEKDSTTPAAETIIDHCFEDDASWEPLDMQNQGMTLENDAVACQRRCLSVPGCMHFSFLNATKSCHLQDAFAFHKPNSLGFVSGPFSCQGIRPGQEDYVNIGDRTYLPKELGCLELGTAYAPDLGTLSIFSPEKEVDHGIVGMNSIRNCQRQCNVTKGCKHFTIQFPAGYCKLAGASAKPLANIEGAVSGPRTGCNAASALVTDGLGAIMVKDTVGMTSVDRVGGIGTSAMVVLLVLASITAVAFRFQRGIYERLKEQQDCPDDSGEGEPNQAPLLV